MIFCTLLKCIALVNYMTNEIWISQLVFIAMQIFQHSKIFLVECERKSDTLKCATILVCGDYHHVGCIQGCRKFGKMGRSSLGNRSAASQVKSNNTPRIARKPPNGLYEFLLSVTMVQYLALWRNCYPYLTIAVSCCLLVVCRVANLAFLKPNFEIQAFFDALGSFWKSKIPVKIWLFFFIFFSLKGLALAKHFLSCVFITNFWRESMTMQGARNIAKILLLP